MPIPTLIKYLNGQQEALIFEPLSNTELYQFLDFLVAGQTPAIIALNARRSLEWVNSLDLDCFLDLAAQFIRANFPMAMRMALKDPIAGLKFGPMLNRIMNVLGSLPGTPFAPTPGSMAPNGGISPNEPAPADSPGANPASVTATLPPTSGGS